MQLRALLLKQPRSVVSDGNDLGTWQRFIVFDVADRAPNSEGSPSVRARQRRRRRHSNFLHFNPYPNTAAPGQPRECEAGNEPYIAGQQVIGNAPGNQGTITEGPVMALLRRKKPLRAATRSARARPADLRPPLPRPVAVGRRACSWRS